ncbi:hypothetical protein ACVME8_001790 [Bradyrhizobium diazoefficiens]
MKTITTDVQVRNLKPAAEDYRRTVGGNLYLLIKANGSKLWRYDYKVGTRKTLAIGAYPEVSLSDAMTARDNAARLVKRGIDPKDHRDQERRAEAERKAAESPFGADADGWLKTREGSAKKTYLRDELMVRYLKEGADSIPGFGAVNTNQVALSHILPLLNHFNHETRRRLLSTARNVISSPGSTTTFRRIGNRHLPRSSWATASRRTRRRTGPRSSSPMTSATSFARSMISGPSFPRCQRGAGS